MSMNEIEIIDVQLHAWFEEDTEEDTPTLFTPHKPATINEQVFKDTLAQMDALGISQGVLSGPNNVTIEWCQRVPGRFIPAWMVDPNPADPEEEAARFVDALDNQGFQALGELLMPYLGVDVNDERFFPLYRICQERQLPVFFHTGLDGPDYHRGVPAFRVNHGHPLLLEDVAVAFPELKIVMYHMSYPFTEQATYMLYAHSNVYMEVGVVNWILGRAGFHRLLKQVVEVVGADKILFGSDQMGWPHQMPAAVQAIQDASFLSEGEKRKILGENARRLLGSSEIEKPV